MTKTVTESYLDGIREGRKAFNANCKGKSAAEIREWAETEIDNLNRTAKTFSAGPVKDSLKGERDFWKNQIKKLNG